MEKVDEQQTNVIDDKFKDELLHRLNKLRKSNFRCDTTVRAEGQDFAVHSNVLSAASDYFMALFASELFAKEKQNNLVELNEMKSTTLAEVLQFIYTGEANISSSNAQDLVVASDYLIIPSLKSKAAKFLAESMSASNCLSLESFASKYNCDSLWQAALEYKCQHFTAVVKSEDFLSLRFEQVKEFMCEDKLNISEEEQVYEAVMAWVKHDLSTRESFLPDLLKCLRLFSMSKYSLRAILNTEQLIAKNPICTNILNSGLDFFLFPDRFLGKSFKHRSSIEKEEYAIVINGGYEDDSEYLEFSRQTCCFVLATKEWQSLCPMSSFCLPESGNACVSAVCSGRLYVVGDNSPSVSCFNPQKNTWKSKDTEFPSQIDMDFTVTSLNEDFFVIGGYLKSEGVAHEAHKYNPIRNEWKQLASMETGRAGHCTVVLEDLIYVIAGHNTHICLNSVESYNTLSNQWSTVPALTNARRYFSAAAVSGKIVVVGGYCEIGALTAAKIEPSCEIFDPFLNQWSVVSSPKVPRGACGILTVDNTVYVFGGQGEGGFLDSVECFDVKCNEWHELAVTMPVALSFVQASLLKVPKKFISSSIKS